MPNNSISLTSLLQTHESPFVIINASLVIDGMNKAWEQQLNMVKQESIGNLCCNDAPNCRHAVFFKNIEPYESTENRENGVELKFKGYPLLDKDGTIYLGESIVKSTAIMETSNTPSMIGNGVAFSQFREKLLKASKTLAPVFLMGETGAGKELASDFIHSNSSRSSQELVIVDCTVLSEDLFESEVFGHEKGAFTGATSAKKGLFELADNGTLFLDEIGDLPLSQQPKLLRALETGTYRRVGGTSPKQSNVRVICATHRNLAEMVKQGRFREDLYYRLSVFPIAIPPLRERLDDIPNLTQHLLNQISLREGQTYSINKKSIVKLLQHQWPGNIRELKNCLQLACSICENQLIEEQDITYMQQTAMETNTPSQPIIESPQTKNPLKLMELEVIQSLITKHNGNRKLMAAEMDISERTLYRKLKSFNL